MMHPNCGSVLVRACLPLVLFLLDALFTPVTTRLFFIFGVPISYALNTVDTL